LRANYASGLDVKKNGSGRDNSHIRVTNSILRPAAIYATNGPVDVPEGAMLNTEIPSIKPQVCRGEGQTDYKRALAYRMLGIGPQDFQRIAYFGAQLRRIARIAHIADGYSPSGAPLPALALLETSDNPEAIKVRDAYMSIPETYRRLLPPEAFCCAAGVSPWVILDAITVAAVRSGAMGAAIVAAVNMPRVVQKTVEMALTNDGAKERFAFHKATGFLSSKQTAT
jgi:hypothetical protein